MLRKRPVGMGSGVLQHQLRHPPILLAECLGHDPAAAIMPHVLPAGEGANVRHDEALRHLHQLVHLHMVFVPSVLQVQGNGQSLQRRLPYKDPSQLRNHLPRRPRPVVYGVYSGIICTVYSQQSHIHMHY